MKLFFKWLCKLLFLCLLLLITLQANGPALTLTVGSTQIITTLHFGLLVLGIVFWLLHRVLSLKYALKRRLVSSRRPNQ